jgi:hypothetical protein
MSQNSQSPKKKPNILLILLCVTAAILLALGIYLLVRNSALKQENANLTAANEQTAAQLSDLQQGLNQPANDLTAANQQLSALQAEYDAYKADSQTQLAAADAARQAEVQAVKDADAAGLSALQTEYDAFKTDTQAVKDADTQQLSALQAEYDAYKASVENAAGTTGTTEATGTTGTDSLATLQAEFDAYKASTEADLKAASDQLSALWTEYDDYKAKTETAATAGTDAQTTDTNAEALTALQAQFDAYKADAEAAQATLQTEFDTYKADAQAALDAAIAIGETTQTTADSNTQALAALQTEFDTYKATAANQLAALQAEFDAYKATAADQLSALQTEYDAYKATAADQLSALQTEYDAYQTTAEASLATAQQAATAAEKLAAESSIPADTNGAANQANGNLAVFYEGNVYYTNNYQSGNIYVENADGYGDIYLRRTSSGDVNSLRNIAAVENGYLYYLNSNRLFRLDLENGESTFLKNNMDLYSDNAMLIYDDRIYFLKSVFGADGEPADNLYLVDFRCNNLENVPGVSAYAFVGADRTIYYTEAGTYNVVKYDLVDKVGAAILQAGGSKITNLTLADNLLYFCKDSQLMSMTTDGANVTAISDVQAGSINVIGDWIYYTNLSDGERIYRITAGGLYDELLCDVPNAGSLSIAGDWLYFIQYAGDQQTIVDTYKVKLDGTGLTLAKP